MAELTPSSLLQRGLLDERRYVQSLLDNARTLAMIDDAWIGQFHRKLRSLLLDKCRAFTGGRSDSVRRETAVSIGESILFTLGVQLKRFEPVEALAMLQNDDLGRCFQEGRALVDRMVQSAELLHRSELRHPLPVENDLLRDTLTGGIAGFFKLYNPEYGAQEIHITADYPTLSYPQGWQGIEFIRRYLDGLVLENRFLRLFPSAAVHRCLSLYALRNDSTLGALCDNLFEITLACALRPLLPPKSSKTALPTAGYALLKRLECESVALREYVVRACVEHAADLLRIQQLMAD